jgi:hypothetical protein
MISVLFKMSGVNPENSKAKPVLASDDEHHDVDNKPDNNKHDCAHDISAACDGLIHHPPKETRHHIQIKWKKRHTQLHGRFG